MNDNKPKIETQKNGPYKVEALEKMRNSRGEKLETPPLMFLCRCGGSANKPFCDGTHLKNGFSDGKEEGRVPDRMDDYVGDDVTIHDNRGVCSHRGHCTDNLPSVWRQKKEPWIDPDAAETKDIIRVIEMCPSGALSYTQDEVLHKDVDNEPAVEISKDGPYDVQGFVELDDPEGNTPESKEHYTLCRCGHSRNKPFCDGQHWYVKFRDPKN
ncbi:CDGSH iron-sulfur domain-containing protein [Acidobacteriota bacterium]